MSKKEYYFELSCLFQEYYYERNWKAAKDLYKELIDKHIIPELIFDYRKWIADRQNSCEHCIATYFKEDEHMKCDTIELIFMIMTPYPHFMGNDVLKNDL